MKSKKLLLKRVLSLAVVMVMALSFNCLALASQKQIDTPHTYSVVPGSNEWAAMSVDERIASCKVSKEEVEMMTTEALIETVVNYPYIVNMLAYDTIGIGIEMVSGHFPGIKELLNREDAYTALKNYVEVQESKGLTRERNMKTTYADILVFVLESSDVTERTMQRGSNTTVYTPNLSPVSAYMNQTLAEYEQFTGITQSTIMSNEQTVYGQTYPNAALLRGYTASYNCFSYAFYSQTVNNNIWVISCDPYITDGSYTEVYSQPVNARVTYSKTSTSSPMHAGIVYSASGTNIWVTSKWTANGLYRHPINECPYYVDNRYLSFWVR